jgi:hypothetical protein
VKILQDQLEEERRLCVDLEARMRAKREAERLAEQQRMREILAYMESLGAATGVAPPASFCSPPQPRPPPPDPFSTCHTRFLKTKPNA